MLSREFELYKAAENGDVKTVRKLLKDNTPYNIRFDKDGNKNTLGRDAFFIAAKKGHAEVVELLLKAGTNPNATYLAKEVSALHVAAHFGHSEVIKLLIKYHADVNVCDKENNTAIDAADSAVIDILIKAGAIKATDQHQSILIANFNLLVDRFNVNKIGKLSPLNETGICDGLAKLYIFYIKQNRLDEFKFYIEFINNLNKEDTENLANQYTKNPSLRIINNKFETSYSLNKLLDFIGAVQKTYETQLITNYKSIGANWDATNIITCDKSELAMQLKACNVMKINSDATVQQFKSIYIPKHAMALYIDYNGAYFYDSNNPKGDIFCKNEEELAEALIVACGNNPKNVMFRIDDISYGNENRFIDDWISENSNFLESNKIFQLFIESYQRGLVSRRDLVFCLYQNILAMWEHDAMYIGLKNDLKRYLDTHPSNSFFTQSFNMDTDKNKKSLFSFACDGFAAETIIELIAKGADINQIDKNDFNPLHIAVELKNYGMVLFLLNNGAKIDLVTKDGMTPLHCAVMSEDTEMVSLLLKCGANVNTYYGDVTPLHDALLSNSKKVNELVTLLINHGADVKAPTQSGITPIQLAAHKGYRNLVKLMESTKIKSPNASIADSFGIFSQNNSIIDHSSKASSNENKHILKK